MDSYEKAYKDALERARYVLHTVETAGCAMHKDLLTEIFPELRESEDEKIRKDIVASVEMRGDLTQGRKSEIYAYLEKQKEQKPAKDKYQQELEATDRWQEGYEAGYNAASRPAWSEEDERILNGIIGKIDHDQTYGVSKEETLNFLKKL